MTILISSDYFKSSGLFSLFKRSISTHYEVGGSYLNSVYNKGYAILVTLDPSVGFLNAASRVVVSLIFSSCDGKYVREITAYYRRQLRDVDNVEIWLGERLALLLRSFINYVVNNGSSSTSEFERQFGGLPIPKVCVWIIQTVRLLNSRITIPMSTIQITFSTTYVLNDDEFDDIATIVGELNLYGKLASLTLDQVRSGIVISSRVLSNSVPGTFCAFIDVNRDGQSFVNVDSNYYPHDVFFNLMLGTRIPNVDRNVLTYHTLELEWDDIELINRFALWFLNSLTGKVDKLEVSTIREGRSDSFYPNLFNDTWNDGMETIGDRFDDGSPPKF